MGRLLILIAVVVTLAAVASAAAATPTPTQRAFSAYLNQVAQIRAPAVII